MLLFAASALSLLPLAFLVMGQWRFARRRDRGANPVTCPPLSVVIAAKDEAHNLPALLDALRDQDYPAPYEVILVLDRCRDDSEVIARARPDGHLRVHAIYELPAGWTGKKWALEQGIQAAKYPHLAFTDADCLPETSWLHGLGKQFARGYEVVLGLGLYRRRIHLLNYLVQYETHLTALTYLGLASWGYPYMGVGRNLGYTREFYQRAGGMTPIADRLSGDDDLLIDRHARTARTGWMTEPGTRTWSEAPPDWKSWWHQKIRHLSAGTSYQVPTQLILFALNAALGIFYLSLGIVLCSKWPLEAELWGLIILRYGTGSWLLTRGYRFKLPRQIALLFPLLEVMYLLYLLILVPASLILKPKWRGK
ncbi:MAG: glycosyltransferase [Bacteroidota bacterium]